MKTEKQQTEEKKKKKQAHAEAESTPEQSQTTDRQDCTEETPQEETTSTDELKEKIADLTDRNLRLMAEFDNYRKRTLKERTELIKTAGENIFVDILPLIDDFERALKAMEAAQDVEAVREGVQLIYEKFINFLSQNGVKEVPTKDASFDVDMHEAVTTFPAPDEEMKGKIMDCVNKGYTLNDRVIRYSKVVVYK